MYESEIMGASMLPQRSLPKFRATVLQRVKLVKQVQSMRCKVPKQSEYIVQYIAAGTLKKWALTVIL